MIKYEAHHQKFLGFGKSVDKMKPVCVEFVFLHCFSLDVQVIFIETEKYLQFFFIFFSFLALTNRPPYF